MNKKRLVAILSAVAVVATLFAGCAAKKVEENNQTASTKKETKVKIGLATDAGGKGDKSFNDSAIAGLERVKTEYSINPQVLESKKEADYEPFLKQLGEGNDLTFGVGFLMQKSLDTVASAKKDKKFALIDAEVKLPNVVSVLFKEEEGSFLMGVIAGKTTKTNKIGFIGGMDIPLIQKFEAGFVAGVKSVNEAAAADLVNRKNVYYAGVFTDPQKGTEGAKKLYGSGVDIIYHASGSTGIGLLDEAQSQRAAGKDVWAIGVDSDQAVALPKDAGAILSSCMKRVDLATFEISKSLIDNNFAGGTTKVYGLKEKGIGMADTTSKNTKPEVMELAKKYEKAIIDGKFVVPTTQDGVKAFKPVQP